MLKDEGGPKDEIHELELWLFGKGTGCDYDPNIAVYNRYNH